MKVPAAPFESAKSMVPVGESHLGKGYFCKNRPVEGFWQESLRFVGFWQHPVVWRLRGGGKKTISKTFSCKYDCFKMAVVWKLQKKIKIEIFFVFWNAGQTFKVFSESVRPALKLFYQYIFLYLYQFQNDGRLKIAEKIKI